MFLTRIRKSTRSLFYFFAVFAIAAVFLGAINDLPTTNVAAQDDPNPVLMAPEAVFPGTGTGPIADGPVGGNICGDFGAALDITFAVSGMTGPLTDVRVNFTGTHTWIADLDATLIAPANAANFVVFKQVGAATAAGCGDSSNIAGLYEFFDTAPAAPTFWAAAAAVGDAVNVPPASYRTSAALTGANTTMTPAFAGLSTAQINGNWILRIRDGGEGDLGTITAANLNLTGSGAPVTDAMADFDGDGTTDYSTIRAAGGQGSQATWHVNSNSSGNFFQFDWGLAGDWFVPADLNGDGKDDIVVWRTGVQGTFYALLSGTNTILIDDFGLAGDDPSVVGDYDGDGDDELAVYRSGVAPGAQSSTFWKNTTTYNRIDWGITGDATCNADYDGDNKVDFCVQRGNVFYRRFTGGGADSQTTLGVAGDIVAPGDYDGDAKADLAVVSGVGGFWQWTYRRSIDGADVVDTWGVVLTDDPAPGDYTGDGRADYGVWRFGTPSTFHVMTPVTRLIRSRQWGLVNDIAVTTSFTH